MKKIFGGLNMTWLGTILFAIGAGAYTGLVMLVPFLDDTSFQDIGIMYEWWVIFAVIVVTNCKRNWEAALKCFLFFLLSQPTVYLVEIVFGSLSFGDAWDYYSGMWLPMTFLTLPGGFIAFFCKKQNPLGGLVLGLGNTIQAVLALVYLGMAARSFPRHLLSALVCLGSMVLMTFCIQEKQKNRLTALLVPLLLGAAVLLLLKLTGRVLF